MMQHRSALFVRRSSLRFVGNTIVVSVAKSFVASAVMRR